MGERSSFKKNVLVPAGQSAVLGIFVWLTSLAILTMTQKGHYSWSSVIGLVSTSACYWMLTWKSCQDDGQNIIAPVQTRTFNEEVNITLIDKTREPYQKGRFIKIKKNRNKLIELAHALDRGVNFSGTELSGKGKIFSRGDYEKLRGEFLDGGIVRWKDEGAHTLGLEMTVGGWAFVRHFTSLKNDPFNPSPARRLQNQRLLIESFDAQTHANAQRG